MMHNYLVFPKIRDHVVTSQRYSFLSKKVGRRKGLHLFIALVSIPQIVS